MQLRRGLRRWLSGSLLLAILFTQVVTAAYACPTHRAGVGGDPTAGAALANLPCEAMLAMAVELDPEQPGLCAQHCQIPSTVVTADAGQAGLMPALAPAPGHVALAPAPARAVDDTPWPQRQRHHDRMPRLAHSVVHCCYRL